MTNWTFRRLGEEQAGERAPAVPVTLPHDAMLDEPRTLLSAGGVNTGWYEGRDYEYTRILPLPAEAEGKSLILEFEGVYHNAEVWVNGRQAAFRPYGYTNFCVDLEGLVRFGQDNELRVIARNADQPNSRWYSGAGIYRPVTLWVGGAQHILPAGLRVRTLAIGPARLEIDLFTRGDGPAEIDILDGETCLQTVRGEVTGGRLTLQTTLPDARLWTPGQVNRLYTCRARFAGDEAAADFGVRTLDWGPQGLRINGQRVILRGACIHHDNGILGACAYPEAEARKVRLMAENGYNALRSAHNPCSRALLDACDRQGMLVMDEYVDAWYIHKTQYDYVNYLSEWWRQDLQDMVDKDYNHPSVILYSTGNEVSETAQPRGIAFTGEMTRYLHSLDATRPVTCGVNIFFNFLSAAGFGVYNDEKARKEAEQAERLRREGKLVRQKAVGSEFFNNLAGLLGDNAMKVGATLYPCDLKTRDAFANMDVAGYNYSIYRYRHDLKKYPDRLILGTETFCRDAWRFWEQVQDEPRLLGDFVWSGMDYLGEVGVGAWEYRDYAPDFSHGPGWVTAGSGRVDLTGSPLGEALYTRVVFGQANGPLMAVCPVNHTDDRHSPSAWKMSNALPSWSWNGCEGRPARVEVYARAAWVELWLNGERIARRRASRTCRTLFRVKYRPGTLVAVSRDEAGRELGRCTLRSAGSDTCLQAIPEQAAPAPGGLWYVRLRYTDHAGLVKPLERGVIQVEVQGGSLLGLGSACPYSERGYRGRETDTYYGEALAIVRADPEADCVTLTARDGRYSTSVTARPAAERSSQ